jgi:hypothetical protein
MTEKINHPPHYGGDVPFEAIKIIEDWALGFSLGNALKYLIRAPHKGTEQEDLRKCLWYLKRAQSTHHFAAGPGTWIQDRIRWEDAADYWHLDADGRTALCRISIAARAPERRIMYLREAIEAVERRLLGLP